MKSTLLLLLRISTGLLLVIWGLIKIAAPDAAIRVSEKYYSGALSGADLQTPLGIAEIALGALVVLGLFRAIVYPLQALVLVVGVAAIWRYIADPLGLWLLTEETRQVLFFPSTTVAIASLLLLAYRSDDRLTVDSLLFRR
jgi:uncharacterized membrane protein YphA (DoxX/SURF4 family)